MNKLFLIVAIVTSFFRPAGFFSDLTGGLGDIAGGLLGIGGGAKEAQGAGNAFTPTQGMNQADQWWQQLMPQLMARNTGVAGQIDPQLLQSYMQMLGINTNPLTAAGAGAGQEFGALAGQGTQDAGALNAAGMSALGRGDALWKNAADTMQSQHDLERHNVMENVRGAESARGIAMGGQGAGLEAEALGKFDIDWKNFMDQRMLQANQGAGLSDMTAGQNFGQGMNIGAQVPGYTMAGAQVPFGAQVSAAQFPAQAATGYAGNVYGTDPYGSQLAQLGTYMGHTYGNFGMNPAQVANMRNSGLGNIAGGLPGLFGGMGDLGALFGGGGGAEAGLAGLGGFGAGGAAAGAGGLAELAPLMALA